MTATAQKSSKPKHLPSAAPGVLEERGALGAAADAGGPSSERERDRRVEWIALDDIAESDRNHRIPTPVRAAQIKELAESIRRRGVQQPVKGWWDLTHSKFHLVFGFGRVEASRLAGRGRIPADVLLVQPTDAEVEAMRNDENFKRLELTAAEKALATKNLVDALAAENGGNLGKAIAQAAEEMVAESKWVKDCLQVIENLGKPAKDALAAGKLTLEQARELAKVGDPKMQAMYVDDIAHSLEHNSITPATEIQGWVQNEKKSLMLARWSLTVLLPTTWSNVKQGDKKIEQCATCHYNTRANAGLFETGNEEPEKGSCLRADCFEMRKEKAVKVEVDAVKKVKEQIKAKDLNKADAGGIEVARDLTPEGFKPEAVQRALKKELGLGTPAKAAAPKSSGGGGSSSREKPLTPAQKLIIAWGKELTAWRSELFKQIVAKVDKEPVVRLKAILLAMVSMPSFRVPVEDREFRKYGGYEGQQKPPTEKMVAPRIASLLAKAGKNDLTTILAIAEEVDPANNNWGNGFRLNGISAGPELCKRIATVFGVTLEKPAPEYMAPGKGVEVAAPAKKGKGKASKKKPADVDEDPEPLGDGDEDFDDDNE